MTKKQRIRYEIQQAIRANAVGAARTQDLLEIRQKYAPGRLSTRSIDKAAMFVCYPAN